LGYFSVFSRWQALDASNTTSNNVMKPVFNFMKGRDG